MSMLRLAAKVAYLKVLVEEIQELMMEYPDVEGLGIEMVEAVDVPDRVDSLIVKIYQNEE